MSVFGIIRDKQIIRFLDTEKTISTKRSKKEKSSNRALKINFTQIPSRFKTFASFPSKDLPLFLPSAPVAVLFMFEGTTCHLRKSVESVTVSAITLS